MALSQTKLAIELVKALQPNPTQDISTAFGNYFKDAVCNLVSVSGTAVDNTAVPAMRNAMVFTVPGTAATGAGVFVSGVTAFWASMSAAPATFFAGSTVVTPPTTLSSLSAALQSDFASNLLVTTTAAAASNLAASLHSNAGLNGTATFVVPFAIA